MGMASSQVRLLSLTARQHAIELRAQNLQAQKLQLANDSKKVYNQYLEALNMTKIQTKVCDILNGDSFQDATLAILENGLAPDFYSGMFAQTPLFLQDLDGKIMITREIANQFGLTESEPYTGTLDEYLVELGTPRATKVDSYTKIANVDYAKTAKTVYTPQTNTIVDHLYELDPVNKNLIDGVDTIYINTAEDLKLFLSDSHCKDKNVVLMNDIDMSTLSDYDTASYLYSGTFNGNGHTISGINKTLFNDINGGRVENVKLNATTVNGHGILVYSAVNASIENVKAYGTVRNDSSTPCTAGLVGYINHTSINQCSYSGTVYSNDRAVGGLVGEAVCSSIQNCTSSGNVTGNLHCGGFAGCVTSSSIKNCTSNANITVHNAETDFQINGITWYGHPDSGGFVSSLNSDSSIDNCVANGTLTVDIIASPESGVKSVSGIGGFVGVGSGNTDASNPTKITNCESNVTINYDWSHNNGVSNINAAGFFAHQEGGYYEIDNCNSNTTITSSNAYTYGFYTGGNGSGVLNGSNNYSSTSTSNGKQVSTSKVSGNIDSSVNTIIPNTINVTPAAPELNKNDKALDSFVSKYTVDEYINGTATMTSKVALTSNLKESIIKSGNSANDNSFDYILLDKLNDKEKAILNDQLCEYLNKDYDTDDSAVEDAKNNDLIVLLNETLEGKAGFYDVRNYLNDICNADGRYDTDNYVYVDGDSADACKKEQDPIAPKVDIPSDEDMVDELTYAIQHRYNIDATDGLDIEAFISALSLQDKASVNKDICDERIDNIYECIVNGTSYENKKPYASYADEDITQLATQGIEYIEVPFWDKTDPIVAKNMTSYVMAKRGIVIVDDSLAQSKEYLVNMLYSGKAVLTKFDPDGVRNGNSDFEGLSPEEYDRIMGIEETSIAVESSIDEIPDTSEIKVAESEYESAMRKINRKETKMDTEIEELDAERIAVKAEQDSLKKVVDDNINLSFKLFS